MSKKYQHEQNDITISISDKNKTKSLKLNVNSLLELIIGIPNVKRWNNIKKSFSCNNNEIFTTKLLNLADDYLKRKNRCNDESDYENNTKKPGKENVKIKKKKKDTRKIQNDNNIDEDDDTEMDVTTIITTTTTTTTTTTPTITILEHTKDISNNINTINNNTNNNINNNNNDNDTKELNSVLTSAFINTINSIKNPDEKEENQKLTNNCNNTNTKSVRREKNDIRKAPELDLQIEIKSEKKCQKENDINIKIKLCLNCGTRHIQDHCPLNYPDFLIIDTITHEQWLNEYKILDNDSNTKDDYLNNNNKFSYAKVSLPHCLKFQESPIESHGVGVFAQNDIQEFSQFGPLIGKTIKEVDISEDSTMKDIWEICQEGGNIYFNTDNLTISNWMRFVRPAPTREEKNITVVTKQNNLYFVSTSFIVKGDELLFWQDSITTTNKKKMEKTTCGGCNMTFSHPLYYRTHCSVFHDIRYSLTIRKYHCKVCGAAVLGKENIMKHAAELHNGQGAYQCQFCKKFFLRLNYLEMHRTYGCSANPHRSRPLCDFCGRKFCQPQKLKVHIKRMHSDLAEVLKEFQCKNCLKILGSRAALQRHAKEVHQKQIDVTCSCTKCGKHFQNKSNLKIHMLTHSGIKPFKCIVDNCNAAFTTKQCLQFHYKKVHNYNENGMPKIERSIDYTFEAYSGLEENEEKEKNKNNSLDEDSDSNDSKIIEDSTSLQSPSIIDNENDSSLPEPTSDSNSKTTQIIENYNINSLNTTTTTTTATTTTTKILTKGSKKWISDQPLLQSYQLEHNLDYERPKTNIINDFSRHETSNASLLVEAALDSVCSEPNIDIDVGSTSNCTDALVNNLYTLAPTDTLPDVSYNETVCINENRDISLISPSVNDHISVTDDLNDHQNQTIGLDYSNFHQENFTPENSPEIQHRSSFRNYISAHTLSSSSPPLPPPPPQQQPAPPPSQPQSSSSSSSQQTQSLSSQQNYQKSPNPVPSPPRYNFGHGQDHLSSDDNSNGMAAQNLSLHGKHNIQLDLSIYKTPYKLEVPCFRKDFRLKNYDDEQLDDTQTDDLSNVQELKDKSDDRSNTFANDLTNTDTRTINNNNKFELDLDLRLKNYEDDLRTKTTITTTTTTSSSYDTTGDIEFRKNYDIIDKNYDTIETNEFRTDRNFEPLIINSELQGLDMSARSFHNYQNINRYHHLYSDVDRVDLRLNYSPPAPPPPPPPPPTYTHADILRVVSLDLTPPGRHSVDLSLRSHPLHQIHTLQSNHRLLDPRHLTSESTRLLENSRILTDHATNRLLTNNEQINHLLTNPDDTRLIADQTRLLEQQRLISDGRILPPTTPNGVVSPVAAFSGYTVSQSPYHPTALAPRPHVTSPTSTPFHHYSTYY